MKKFALSCLALALAFAWGSTTAHAAVTLTLVPSASSVALGGMLTLTATVSGTSNLGLTWSVNGVTDGNSTQGTLTACTTVAPLTCKYTAPSVNVPSPNPVTFEILSAADTSVSKTTTATVTDSIAVTLTPSSASKALGATQVFTATLTGTTNTVLNWYVNGIKNGSSAQGMLTGCTTTGTRTCTYTAPPVDVPNPNPAVIKVASGADAAKNKTATVTVTDGIAVTLAPSSASVALGASQVFTATITGATSNAALNWYVNGVKNGNSTQGTLSACTTTAPLTCKYTAPPLNVPSPNPAVIEVASAADPGKNKSANATVTDNIAVTLSPTSVSKALGSTQVFTATLTATTNTGLSWYVNGVLNGNSTQGTLTGCTTTGTRTCTYTAPSVDVPSPNPAVIKVASAADPGKNKTANFTVTDSIAVGLTPSSGSIALGATQVFTATISGTTNTAMNWYVNGVKNGSSTQGTITACTTSSPWKCTYTAPSAVVPSPNPAVIEVASAADPGKNKSANVTVTDSIAVGLTPLSASIAQGATQVFTATISGTTNAALNWYVNGVKNGSSAQGTITACTTSSPWKCTYTAPSSGIPSPNPAVIEVASAADPGKNKSANVTVTDSIVVGLSPTSASIALGATQVFTATISGATNTALNWYVNGVKNGNSTQGTISACASSAPWTCTYTAPASVPPSPNPAVIEVASAADPSKNKSANVTVTGSIAVGLSPSSASVAVGATQVFTATISGTTNTALDWYVNGVKNGNSTQGTITACTTSAPWTCTYTAPPVDVPSPNPAVIEVASAADAAVTKTANVTVTSSIVMGITSPTSPPTLPVGRTLPITASITGTTNIALTWTVNGVTNGNSTYGTITGSGLTVTYTAPASVPSPATFNIQVTSQADPSKSATLSVTISGSVTNTAQVTVGFGPNGDTGNFETNYFNNISTTVTVCQPGTSICQIIDNVLLDTASVGLRLFSSELSGLTLPVAQDTTGNPLYECIEFGTLDYTWGPVQYATVQIGGETASQTPGLSANSGIPIQVISNTAAPTGAQCTLDGGSNDYNAALLGSNGLLGVATYPQDCDSDGTNYCTSSASNYQYIVCPTDSSCAYAGVAVQDQLWNPIAAFSSGDTNGVSLTLPSISANGTANNATTGTLTFGIGTASNNALPNGAKVFQLDEYGYLGSSTFNGVQSTSLDSYGTFFDSGSNALYISDSGTLSAATGISVTDCIYQSTDIGLYCPSSTQTIPLEVAGTTGTSTTIDLSVANALTLFDTGNSTFSNLGGASCTSTLASPCSASTDQWDIGLSYFFGKTIFFGIAGTSVGGVTSLNGYYAF